MKKRIRTDFKKGDRVCVEVGGECIIGELSYIEDDTLMITKTIAIPDGREVYETKIDISKITNIHADGTVGFMEAAGTDDREKDEKRRKATTNYNILNTITKTLEENDIGPRFKKMDDFAGKGSTTTIKMEKFTTLIMTVEMLAGSTTKLMKLVVSMMMDKIEDKKITEEEAIAFLEKELK